MTYEQLQQRQTTLEVEQGLIEHEIETSQAALIKIKAELDFIYDQYFEIQLKGQETETAMLDTMNDRRA